MTPHGAIRQMRCHWVNELLRASAISVCCKKEMSMKMRMLLAVLAVAAIPTAALADGDATKGEAVFKKCKACHVADEAKNRVGPYLLGIVGRKAATAEGYKYSDAMMAKGAEGLVWDEAALDTYLTKPKDMVPGTKMTFAGLSKPEDRADIIAYLKTKTQ
jgi:cytochrome c